MTIGQKMLAIAALQALRDWLFELGHPDGPVAAAEGPLREVYYLPSMRRLVHVKTALAPFHPEGLNAAEVRALRRLAPALKACAWEARIIVRPNYQPSAILWRQLPAAGLYQRRIR